MTKVNEGIDVTPVSIRRLCREYKTKPNVYASRFDLAEPLEGWTEDGRRVRILGVEIKEGCGDVGVAYRGHVFVNMALKNGSYSQVTGAFGWPLDADGEAVVDAAVFEAIACLRTLSTTDVVTTPDKMTV